MKSSNEIPTNNIQFQQHRLIKQPSQSLLGSTTEPVNRNRNASPLALECKTKSTSSLSSNTSHLLRGCTTEPINHNRNASHKPSNAKPNQQASLSSNKSHPLIGSTTEQVNRNRNAFLLTLVRCRHNIVLLKSYFE